MENLKIKVTTEQESKEVQELFFELGFEWFGSKREVHEKRVGLFFTTKVVGVDCLTYDKDHEFDLVNHKEITIPQLRDLVVLKRNDVGDAQFKDDFGDKWYIDSENVYWMFEGKVWRKALPPKFKLKPIEKEMKEFLEPHPNGNYAFVKAESSLHPSWIEIPDGAEIAIRFNCDNDDYGIIFYKNDGKASASEKDNFKWYHDSHWNNVDLLNESFAEGDIDLSHKVLWVRQDVINNPNQKTIDVMHETEYLMQGKNGERLMESVGQLRDNVNQPNHYTSGGIECLDAMQSMLSRDEFIGFLRGNVFKYNWRYKLKNGIEDLKKAQFYQNKLIELESDDAI